jgi:predicted nucleotidyltransferase component of viral defense system
MLHFETVSPTLLKIIRAVSSDPAFEEFRLVGGTALSLYLGHRQSVDADFFSNDTFDNRTKEAALLRLLPGFSIIKESPHGFAGFYEGVKLDLYTWNIPFLLPTAEIEGIRMAAIPDIVALKLAAVIERKEEKDYRDIHALLSSYPFAQMLAFYKERIPHHDLRLVVDHLSAAPAAERQQSIVLFRQVEYAEVAADIIQTIQSYIATIKEEQVRLAEERLRLRLEAIQKKKL